MATVTRNFVTAEQYLEQERKAEFKSEYRNGEIFAMSGAKFRHVLIVGNCFAELRARVSEQCQVVSNDLRLEVKASGLFTYPDLMVICGEAKFGDAEFDTLLNPTMIIEVLSPSTEAYDRGEKFELYKGLASLKEYVLVAQDKMHVETRVRRSDGEWLCTDYFGHGQVLKFESVGVKLDIEKLYRKVDFAGNRNSG